MNILSRLGDHRDIIHITQDEEGHWHIEDKPQQEADNGNNEPIIRHIGPVHIGINYHHSDHDTDHHFLNNNREDRETLGHIGLIGIGDAKRELIETLQHIVELEGHRGVVIIGAAPFERHTKELTLSDLADRIMEDTRKEIFCIQNTLSSEVDIDIKIKEINTWNQKHAKHHHKFHNQKPSGPKGQYSNSRRK